MRALRMLAWILLPLSAVLPIAEAKTPFAYVANHATNTVSVVNTSNNAVVKSIPVGINPYGVAVNQAGTFAYVSNEGSGSVSVISTSTNTIVATITVQNSPIGVALTPDGKTAYVANAASNSVSVIKTGTKTVTATIPVQNPIGLTVHPNGTFVYVASGSAGSVSVISTLTNKVVATIPVGSNPVLVAISPDGTTAYVTNSGSNSVSVIQTVNNTVVNTINVGSPGPAGAAVSADGRWLYVADSNDGNSGNLVTVIDTTTQTIAATIVVGTGPDYIAFTQDSAFAYVTNDTSNDVSVINTLTHTVVDTITVGTAPLGVAVMGTHKTLTLAGGFVGDKLQATQASLQYPYSAAIDKGGNMYICDVPANRLRKVTPAGVITTIAGTSGPGFGGYNGDNIKANHAMLSYPGGVAVDSAGNLIVAELGNSRIRKIDKAGNITTIAGTGVFGYTGDGGPAVNAAISVSGGLALDSAGNLFFSDSSNSVIRKIDTSGIITTYAGNGISDFSGDGGPATAASLNSPFGIAFDPAGNLYIADAANNRVRYVNPAGIINTFAGNGDFGNGGDGGPANQAQVGHPVAVVFQNNGLYISAGSRVRVVNAGIINLYAGSKSGYDGDGHALLSTQFSNPLALVFDTAGNLVVVDSGNGRLRKAAGGIMTTIAGGNVGDGGPAKSARLDSFGSIRFDHAGNYYIADLKDNRIRKVNTSGQISTVAGNGITGYTGDGGPATSATLSFPWGMAVDSTGNLFVADTGNRVIRKVDTTGTISTFASGNFFSLRQMDIDPAGNLYVADFGACVVWKVTPAAIVSVFAGVKSNCGFNGDNIPATSALLSFPWGVAVDKNGNVLIADSRNNRIREVDTNGIISTVAGDGNCGSSGDGGAATSAELCQLEDVAVTSAGTIFVADFSNTRIRSISNGIINTYAGGGIFGGDGVTPLNSLVQFPESVTVDKLGRLYFLDQSARVRRVQ
ncbi:MAG: beta-propeller fold lactonase family protein [Terriglobales bacterium]